MNHKSDKSIVFSALLALLVITVSQACLEIEKLPPEPSIEFRSFAVSDTIDPLGNPSKVGKLTFYFEDGDGDLGVNSGTSGPGDPADLILTLFRKTDGEMLPAPPDDPLAPSDFRMPFMERLGQNKILKGEVTITTLYLFYSESDTIMYEFYITDRAGNISNSVQTPEIPLYYNGIYQ